MDQNIIILVLILIAILVSFYSTYLSMDNSRKIRQLQNDIRDTLGNINTTLNLEKQNNPSQQPELRTTESRTNLQDLDQFPSLEEIENYDAKKMMEPIDPALKQELDNILDENSVKSEEDSTEVPMIQEVNSVNIVNSVEDMMNVEQPASVDTDSLNVEEIPNPESEPNNHDEEVLVNDNKNVNDNDNALVENENDNDNDNDNEFESLGDSLEVNLEEVAVSQVEMPPLEPVVDAIDTNDDLMREIDALCPENLLDNKKLDSQDDVESVMGEADKKHSIENLPPLEELNEEVLHKMHDKNVKLICKRESLKVRGTKTDRIKRILDAKEYKINLN